LAERITSHPVELRAFTLSDAPRVAELCGDWEVARMTALIPHPYSLEAARSFIGASREAYDAGPAYTYAIGRADDGLLVGAIGVTRSPEAGDSLGYWIGRQHWGWGIAREAGAALLDHASRHPALRRLVAVTDPDNLRSQRVLRALGFRDRGLSDRPSPSRRGSTQLRSYTFPLARH